MGRKSNAALVGEAGEGIGFRRRKGQFIGRAQDRHGQWEAREGFDSATEALEWARAQRAKFMDGATATDARLDVCYQDYEREARADADHKANVKRIVEAAVREGLGNVKAPDFRARLKAWVDTWTNHSFYDKSKPLPKNAKREAKLSYSTKRQYLGFLGTVIAAAGLADPTLGILVNPARGISLGKPPKKKLKPTFTIPELQLMVGDAFRSDPWFLLNCAFAYTGLRAEFAAHLRLEYFRFDEQSLWYNDKNGEDGIAFLQPEFAEIVKEEIARRGMTPENAKGWLIENERIRRDGQTNPGTPMKPASERTSEDSHSAAFMEMLDRLKIPARLHDGRKRTNHSTRHTFIAIHLGRGVVDITTIQRWVGHKSKVMTTKTYGSEAAKFESLVAKWPPKIMCLRHAPDSAFHQPEKPEVAALREEMAEMRKMLAQQAALNAKLVNRLLDSEAIVIPDADEPIPGPGSVSA